MGYSGALTPDKQILPVASSIKITFNKLLKQALSQYCNLGYIHSNEVLYTGLVKMQACVILC